MDKFHRVQFDYDASVALLNDEDELESLIDALPKQAAELSGKVFRAQHPSVKISLTDNVRRIHKLHQRLLMNQALLAASFRAKPLVSVSLSYEGGAATTQYFANDTRLSAYDLRQLNLLHRLVGKAICGAQYGLLSPAPLEWPWQASQHGGHCYVTLLSVSLCDAHDAYPFEPFPPFSEVADAMVKRGTPNWHSMNKPQF